MVCWLATVILLASDVVQMDPAPDHREAEARTLYERGKVAYAEGRYEDAIRLFEEAFDLSHKPLLLYNLSLAYERVGDYRRALERLRGYSAAAPPQEREIVRKRIENLRRRIQAQERPEQAPSLTQPQPEAPSAPAPEAERAPQKQPSITEASPPSHLPAYLTLGAGGLLLGGAAVLGGLALAAQGEVDGLCAGYQGELLCRTEAREPMTRRQNLAIAADVSLGVGIAAVGVGLFLWLFNPGADDPPASAAQPSVSWSPWLGLGSAGLTARY